MAKKKIVLTGSFGVGKTSLFSRFIYDRFSDKYLTTIGVKVEKKVVEVEGEDVILMIWDIAGEISQDKVPDSFFMNASAILYVFDLTRPSTYGNLEFDLNYLEKKVPGVLLKLIGNKKDVLSGEELDKVLSELYKTPDILTSAKTGENVETLFLDLAKSLLDTRMI